MLSFLFFQVRRQLLLYLPDRTTKHNNDFRFVLILVCYSATGLRGTYKLDLLFRNFGFGVLQSQKCYVMFQPSAI